MRHGTAQVHIAALVPHSKLLLAVVSRTEGVPAPDAPWGTHPAAPGGRHHRSRTLGHRHVVRHQGRRA